MMGWLCYDIKKKFMSPMTIELHDPGEKVFHNAPVSPISAIPPLISPKTLLAAMHPLVKTLEHVKQLY